MVTCEDTTGYTHLRIRQTGPLYLQLFLTNTTDWSVIFAAIPCVAAIARLLVQLFPYVAAIARLFFQTSL